MQADAESTNTTSALLFTRLLLPSVLLHPLPMGGLLLVRLLRVGALRSIRWIGA
jgi:hypothetical protein